MEEQAFPLTAFHSVLEFPILPLLPVVTAQTNAQCKHPLYKTVLQYMRERSEDLHHVVISLSGGVDSMVLAHILCQIGRSTGFSFEVVAIHIDYGNREESSIEADFVKRFCALRGIIFHKRRIDEVPCVWWWVLL
jgi:predicted phosphoadenosine phosphosulfate sulfurtransferase